MKILRDSPEGLYGLQIVERGISRGSVYVLLTRLQGKGYVEMRTKSGFPGMPRPHYRLNAVGARVMDLADRLDMLPTGA